MYIKTDYCNKDSLKYKDFTLQSQIMQRYHNLLPLNRQSTAD